MGLVRRRAKRLESAIGICILAILLLVGVGVFIKQFDADISRFGIDTAGTSPQKPEIHKEGELDLGLLAPLGFETLSDTETYTIEDLYEKINGRAPFYIDCGFEKLFSRRFISKEKENLWMELFVYDMGNPRNAFSVYSVQRRADAEVLPDMQFAYKTSNALFFAHGKYCIELIGSSESEELSKAMAEISKKLQADLAIDMDTEMAEPALFPQENLVEGSIKFYLANTFGFDKLTNTFSVKYKFDDETITAFISKRTDPQDAKITAKSYYDFLIENGGTTKQTANKILEGKVIDFYDTTEIVLATGPFVTGIHEAESQQLAENLAVKLINRLSEAAEAKSND